MKTKKNQEVTPKGYLAFNAMMVMQDNIARAWIDNNIKLLKFAQALNLNIRLRMGINGFVDGEILDVNKNTSVIKVKEKLTNHIYKFRSDSIIPDTFYFKPEEKRLWVYINDKYLITTEGGE